MSSAERAIDTLPHVPPMLAVLNDRLGEPDRYTSELELVSRGDRVAVMICAVVDRLALRLVPDELWA
ncbi:hypothetical protein FHS29_007350, partial [Saccharothrix tamanrassetensis]